MAPDQKSPTTRTLEPSAGPGNQSRSLIAAGSRTKYGLEVVLKQLPMNGVSLCVSEPRKSAQTRSGRADWVASLRKKLLPTYRNRSRASLALLAVRWPIFAARGKRPWVFLRAG
jgi:hypothetical protein